MNTLPEKLSKNNLILSVLSEIHAKTLAKLAREEKIWRYAPLPYFVPEVFQREWFEKTLRQMHEGKRRAFVITLKDQIIGSSSYYDIDFDNKKMKIGYTWFEPSQWGTKVNAMSKLVMLEHAFEQMRFNRIAFCVDSINAPSCKALEKMGIKCEGILRNDMVLPDGRIRDSVIFSVIFQEWPDLKKRIETIVE